MAINYQPFQRTKVLGTRRIREQVRTGWEAHDDKIYVFSSVGGFISERTVHVNNEPYVLRQVMEDEVNVDRSSDHYCSNTAFHFSVRGYVPDYLPSYGSPFCSRAIQGEIGSGTMHYQDIPVMYVLAKAVNVVPELFRDTTPERDPWMLACGTWLDAGGRWKGKQLSLNTGFSLFNFLHEREEVVRSLKSHFTRSGIAERWHALMGRHRTAPERVRAIANERLALVYGIDCTLADVKALYSILCGWKANADKYLANVGKVQRVHRDPFLFNTSYESELYDFSLDIDSGPDEKLQIVTEYYVRACSRLAYSYAIPVIKGYLGRLAQLSDSLGVTLDAGIVWDAIPYSFIVDWYVNVSEWLHRNVSVDWLEAEVTLRSLCNSAKIRKRETLYWVRPISASAEAAVVLGIKDSVYFRRVKSPLRAFDPRIDIELSGKPWKLARIVNATALAAQSATKRRDLSKAYQNAKRALARAIGTKDASNAVRDAKQVVKRIQRALKRRAIAQAKKQKDLIRAAKFFARRAARRK